MCDKCKTIDLEEYRPSADDELKLLQEQIHATRLSKMKALLIIHGYDSSGIGGKIRTKIRPWLIAQETKGKIKAVVLGENFDVYNAKAREINNKYSYFKKYYNQCNHGVTIILI